MDGALFLLLVVVAFGAYLYGLEALLEFLARLFDW